MEESKSYIVTQNRDYFLSHNMEYISLKNSSLKKILKIIDIFLLMPLLQGKLIMLKKTLLLNF